MNIRQKLSALLMVLAGTFFLASCTHEQIVNKSVNTLNKPVVKLHVVGNPKELKVKTPGMAACKAASPANGCIAVGKRDTALIKFELKTSPDWYFSTFKICSGASKSARTCTLAKWQQVEFFAAKDITTPLLYPNDKGIINLTKLSDDLTSFYLFDFNSVEQDYFYTITVCSDNASPNCISSDPEIENKGRN